MNKITVDHFQSLFIVSDAGEDERLFEMIEERITASMNE